MMTMTTTMMKNDKKERRKEEGREVMSSNKHILKKASLICLTLLFTRSCKDCALAGDPRQLKGTRAPARCGTIAFPRYSLCQVLPPKTRIDQAQKTHWSIHPPGTRLCRGRMLVPGGLLRSPAGCLLKDFLPSEFSYSKIQQEQNQMFCGTVTLQGSLKDV